jgi:hypothetical protein
MALVAESDLNTRFGADKVARVFCDDGSGTPGPRLPVSLEVGSREAESVLLGAWSKEAIALLVANDEAVKAKVCDLVLADGHSGRPEWQGGSDAPGVQMRKEAFDFLKELARAQKRSRGEEQAGANPHARGGLVTTARVPHSWTFAPSANNRPRGGF